MWPFDDLLDALNALGSWIMDPLGMFWGLVYWLLDLLGFVLYGPMKLATTLFNVLVIPINSVIDFVNQPIEFYAIFTDGYLGIFNGVYFDSIINWALTASVGIAVAFRVYHFVKDISILGNKV